MRGDRPLPRRWGSLCSRFTPHARGSTERVKQVFNLKWVYPACAGIDLRNQRFPGKGAGLPRMRGDRPPFSYDAVGVTSFTPHARGST